MEYKIGEFSQLARLSVKALRYYDDVGLLKPVYIDPDTRYRYYESKQLASVQKIIYLRQARFSIHEIRQLLKDGNDINFLRAREREIMASILSLNESLGRVRALIDQLEHPTVNTYHVVLKTLPDSIIIYCRGMIDSYEQCGSFIEKCIKDMRSANPSINCNDNYVFMAYLDPGYVESNIHVEFAWAVETFGNETETIKFRRLEPIQAACVLVKGPYGRELSGAYNYISQWIVDNNYRITEAPREHYIDGPWNKDNPEDYLTEIQFPVEKIEI